VDQKARLYLSLILAVGIGVPFLFAVPSIIRSFAGHHREEQHLSASSPSEIQTNSAATTGAGH
jgi:hypothetical protein